MVKCATIIMYKPGIVSLGYCLIEIKRIEQKKPTTKYYILLQLDNPPDDDYYLLYSRLFTTIISIVKKQCLSIESPY